MKTDRLLSIVIYLLNHDIVSAAKLAARFEVSKRTILRDIEHISSGRHSNTITARRKGRIFNNGRI